MLFQYQKQKIKIMENILKLSDIEISLLKRSLLKAEIAVSTTLTEASNIRDLHAKVDNQILFESKIEQE